MRDAQQQTRPATSGAAGLSMGLSGSGPSVCVIGAGAAGLAAARILRDEGCRVRILEKSLDVGGVWRYKPEPDAKAPMYRSLVTNLPKETMSFFGFPFPEENQSFTTHGQVLDYICSFADEHNLHPLISLGCPVETVRPVGASAATKPSADSGSPSGEATATGGTAAAAASSTAAAAAPGDAVSAATVGDVAPTSGEASERGGDENGGLDSEAGGAIGKWEVVYSRQGDVGADNDSAMTTRVTEVFDAVCVCSGHYDETFVPAAEGLEDFRGTSMHSREYDRPGVEAFVGKRVLCVGSRSSGSDIAREVASVADVVHVCDRKNLISRQGGEKGNIWWRPALEKFEGANGVRFKGGEFEEVDTVVWATGYRYDFPFLEGSDLLTAPVWQRVHPLYEQLFHVQHPSLSFVGLPQSVVPFPLFEIQANAVAAAITGRGSLPRLHEREQWLLDDQRDFRERGVDPASRGVHMLGARQWDYMRRLLRFAAGPGTVEQGPSTRESDASRGGGGHRGGDDEGGDAAPPAPSPAPPRVVSDAQAQQEASLEGMLKRVSIKEVIYNDAGTSRPEFPGGPDDYRRRQYDVDWESGDFRVSYADRKANGEGPAGTSSDH